MGGVNPPPPPPELIEEGAAKKPWSKPEAHKVSYRKPWSKPRIRGVGFNSTEGDGVQPGTLDFLEGTFPGHVRYDPNIS